MIIKCIQYQDYELEFADGGYTMSYVVMERVNVRILKIETTEGQIGWGEIVRKPDVNISIAAAQELVAIESLANKNISQLHRLVHALRLDNPLLRGLAFGLETAFLDLLSREVSLPLYSQLGGCLTRTVPGYYSFSNSTPKTLETYFQKSPVAHSVIQIKLGSETLDTNHQSVVTALENINQQQVLLADFNGALSTDTAVAFVNDFNDPRLVWEEPVQHS